MGGGGRGRVGGGGAGGGEEERGGWFEVMACAPRSMLLPLHLLPFALLLTNVCLHAGHCADCYYMHCLQRH